MKFKIGDRVEVKDCFDGLHLKGKKGTIVCVRDDSKLIGVEFDEDFPVGHNLGCKGVMYCTNKRGRWGKADDLLLIGTKPLKTPSHIVIWATTSSSDPHKFFTNELESDDFIKSLTENIYVDRNSIILVEIKTVKKIEVVKKLKSKQYKI